MSYLKNTIEAIENDKIEIKTFENSKLNNKGLVNFYNQIIEHKREHIEILKEQVLFSIDMFEEREERNLSNTEKETLKFIEDVIFSAEIKDNTITFKDNDINIKVFNIEKESYIYFNDCFQSRLSRLKELGLADNLEMFIKLNLKK